MSESKAKKDKNKESLSDKNFTEAVKIMANTPPISNEEIIKHNRRGAEVKKKPAMNEKDWWQKMFDQKYLDTYLGNLTLEQSKK